MNPYERELPLWRSLLFVPTNVRAYVDKAHTRGADGIILDLEDSVPLAEKANARGMVAEAAKLVSRNGADVLVRVNAPLELCVRDLETVVSPEICALLLPKIDSASHVRLLAELVDRIEAEKGMPIGHTKFSILVETASAFARVEEIACAHPRIVAVGLGSEDFALDTGGLPDPDVLLYPKQRVAIAARAAGVLPMGIIGTVADFNDEEGYRQVVRNSRRFGFAGASCIHPKVVSMLNDGFGPTADEVAAAKRVVEGFETAKAQGRASITVDGKMIDYPIVDRAERLLALAARIEAKAKRA